MMNIPYYGIGRFQKQNRNKILHYTDRVIMSGNHFGQEIQDFEDALCEYTGRKYAVSLNSCTDSLFFALHGAGIGNGDEVLVTSFSFIASASPILRAGAVPVFIDIRPDTFLMDINELKNKLTPKTKAILAVHLFGQMIDVEELGVFAKSNGLILIEDAAQALGAENKGRKAGSSGLASCLSFDPTKTISALGSGGALLTDNEEMAAKARQLRYHGKHQNDFVIDGFNCRLPGLSCAYLTFQIKELLAARIEKMREIAFLYNSALDGSRVIITPVSTPGNFHVFHKYVIRTAYRDELREFLKSKGIETMIHYASALPDYCVFRPYCHENKVPESRQMTKEVLSLPIYPELENREIDYICYCLQSFNPKS